MRAFLVLVNNDLGTRNIVLYVHRLMSREMQKQKNFPVNSLSCPYAYVKKTGQPSFDDRAFR